MSLVVLGCNVGAWFAVGTILSEIPSASME